MASERKLEIGVVCYWGRPCEAGSKADRLRLRARVSGSSVGCASPSAIRVRCFVMRSSARLPSGGRFSGCPPPRAPASSGSVVAGFGIRCVCRAGVADAAKTRRLRAVRRPGGSLGRLCVGRLEKRARRRARSRTHSRHDSYRFHRADGLSPPGRVFRHAACLGGGLSPEQMPRRIRLTDRYRPPAEAGAFVKLKARLLPPATRISPSSAPSAICGAITLKVQDDRFEMRTARAVGENRPWSRAPRAFGRASANTAQRGDTREEDLRVSDRLD